MPTLSEKVPSSHSTWLLALFLAGCVPTVLMAVIYYSILRNTLESNLVGARHTLVLSLARLVNGETSRPGEMLDYYRTNPLTQQFTGRPPGDQEVQAWLAEAFYSHPRLDGMFLTDAAGRLIDSIPVASPGGAWEGFLDLRVAGGDQQRRDDYFVSPVFLRAARTTGFAPRDCRLGPGKERRHFSGYVGVNILVERVGRRLAAMYFDPGGGGPGHRPIRHPPL